MNPDQLVDIMKRWGNENCTHPEYDETRRLHPEVVDFKLEP